MHGYSQAYQDLGTFTRNSSKIPPKISLDTWTTSLIEEFQKLILLGVEYPTSEKQKMVERFMSSNVSNDLYKYKGSIDYGFSFREIRKKLMACFGRVKAKYKRIQVQTQREVNKMITAANNAIKEENLRDHVKRYADFIAVGESID